MTDDVVEKIILIAKDAGNSIMDVYGTDFEVQLKDDQSPVTKADKNAHVLIENGLKKIDESIPILSEEGKNIQYDDRKEWRRFWLVDPLDGTKDFIKKNDEFTVNIALIEGQSPVFGVVYAPATKLLYWGGEICGTWKQESNSPAQKINVNTEFHGTIMIASSRSHPSPKMKDFLLQFEKYELTPMGSSLKICLVSDGTVHIYPRLGPTMEWDTAASHAILKYAGGEMMQAGKNKTLKYNKKDLLNPEFIAGYLNYINDLKMVN